MLTNFSCDSKWIQRSEVSRSGVLDHRVLETADGTPAMDWMCCVGQCARKAPGCVARSPQAQRPDASARRRALCRALLPEPGGGRLLHSHPGALASHLLGKMQ